MINPHKVCKITTIQQLTHKRTTYTNNKDIITTLNYFGSVGKTLTRMLTSYTKYQKSPGPDNVIPKLIKACIVPLSSPHLHIVNLLFANGHFPS